MITELILCGFFINSVYADGVADVVLSCTLVEDGVGQGGPGASFQRSPATLVLRDVAVPPDESLESVTQFVPSSVPDPDLIVIEAKVPSSVQIPRAGVLLHADCNQQEVMCEISRYIPAGAQEDSGLTYFMVSLDVDGVDFSSALVLQTSEVERHQETLIQKKLGLPLSQSGSLLTEVTFLVFTPIKSVSAPLNGDVLLNCGFKKHELVSAQEVSIEWRLQHRGKGQKVFELRTRPADAGGNTEAHAARRDTNMDAAMVVAEGNASVTLNKLKISDEGTYICTVTLGLFHAQQVIQLSVVKSPDVSLSKEELVLKTPQTLSCHCSQFFPLEVQMEWFSMSPSDTEAGVFPDQGSLSSHRQHGDGTYSLSSHLTVPSTVPVGTTITCRVSHPALDTPLSVSVVVKSPGADSYWLFLGFLVVSVIFFSQLMR